MRLVMYTEALLLARQAVIAQECRLGESPLNEAFSGEWIVIKTPHNLPFCVLPQIIEQ